MNSPGATNTPTRGDVGQRAGTRPSVFSQPVDDHFGPPGRPSALSSEVFPAQHTKDAADLIGVFSGVNRDSVPIYRSDVCSFTGVVRVSTQLTIHRRDRLGGIVR